MSNTRSTAHRLAVKTLPAVTFFLLLLAPELAAQNRPKTVDEGEVAVSKRPTGTVASGPRGSTSPSRATYGVLFILTAPADAEVKINGRAAGKATAGEFRRELLSGRRYTVDVVGGPGFEPYKETVTIKARQFSVVKAALTSRYGAVRVGPVIEGAKILIDDKPAPEGSVQLDKESNTFLIDNLAPGDRKITYDHPDYVAVERVFKISPGTEYTRIFNLEPATVELVVSSDPGVTVYVDNETIGETTPADGLLKRSSIRIGTHEIRLVKDGYEEHKQTSQFEFKKPVRVSRRLVPLPTSAPFEEDFDLVNRTRWMIPTGWTLAGGRLNIASAPQIGYPTNINYRDFVMNFHLRLGKETSAAWAVRVKDAKNYYLFYLSGPKGLFPNRFLTYVVRDNKFDPANPDSQNPVLDGQLVPEGQYDINITANGAVILHDIKPAASGKTISLGAFTDPNKTFLYGNIGFRTVSNERFSIDELFVFPK